MKRRTVLRTLLLMGGASAGTPWLASAAGGANAAGALMGQTWADVHGRPQAMAQWKGRPMLVNFWATWCAPCVKEMPELDTLSKRHPGVRFVGLAVDTAMNVGKFVAKVPVSYPILVTGPSSIALMRELGNGPGALPFTVVLDADGRLKQQTLGIVDIASLDKLLAGLMT